MLIRVGSLFGPELGSVSETNVTSDFISWVNFRQSYHIQVILDYRHRLGGRLSGINNLCLSVVSLRTNGGKCEREL